MKPEQMRLTKAEVLAMIEPLYKLKEHCEAFDVAQELANEKLPAEQGQYETLYDDRDAVVITNPDLELHDLLNVLLGRDYDDRSPLQILMFAILGCEGVTELILRRQKLEKAEQRLRRKAERLRYERRMLECEAEQNDEAAVQ
jgi:hypothetical protein